MKKFEEPIMNISLFCENVLTDPSNGITLHKDAGNAAGSTLISRELADLYSISYAEMEK